MDISKWHCRFITVNKHDDAKELREVTKWCTKNFGNVYNSPYRKAKWTYKWYEDTRNDRVFSFYFQKVEDSTLFTLWWN